MTTKRLTGRFYFKRSFWGDMVLYVEEITSWSEEGMSSDHAKWRKGTEIDIKVLDLH